MFISLFLVLSGVSAVTPFMWDDPCFVMPSGPSDPDTSMNVTIPSQCKNGTLYWSYPRGHLLLCFDNRMQSEMSICLRDYAVGRAFHITDMNNNQPIGEFDYNTEACTESTIEKAIILKVDAPHGLLYMSGFYFRIDN